MMESVPATLIFSSVWRIKINGTGIGNTGKGQGWDE